MRVPRIDVYNPDFYEEVVSLLENEGMNGPKSPSDLEGLALVARDEKHEGDGLPPIVGFVWALAAEGCTTAYVDYFTVKKEVRGTMVGMWLLGSLVQFLQMLGVERVVSVVPPHFTAYLRMLRRRGADDHGAHQFVTLELGDRNGK